MKMKMKKVKEFLIENWDILALIFFIGVLAYLISLALE
jgi:hypothetical protein